MLLQVFTFSALLGISLAQGCGQNFAANRGTFQSPNYPSDYPNNAQCVWVITADPNTQITLTFSNFNLESGGSSCPYDFVQVYDGNSPSANILSKECGATIPQSITSTGNTMYIKFVSDIIITRGGFLAQFNAYQACGQALQGNQGSLQSPNFPNNYDPNVNCVWGITTDPNTKVTLRFSSFNVTNSSQCTSDSLSVYDGTSINAFLLAKLCGNEAPDFITSSGNSMFVVLRTSSLTDKGFEADYSTNQGCEEVLTGNDGNLESANFPQYYPYNSNCTWFITTDPGTQVTLHFLDFNIEASNFCIDDHLSIYDGVNSSAPQVARICGNRPSAPLTLTGNTVFLKFNSNNRVTRQGFKIRWSTTGPACGQALTASTGTIQSPNHPNAYPSDTQCVWTITAPLGYHIRFNFSAMSLPPSPNCVSDFLEVREGTSQVGDLRFRSCSSYIPSPILSRANTLFFFFNTHTNTNAFTGFSGAWSFEQGCGGALQGNTGSFSSPNYPSNYPNGENCVWTITSDPGTVPTLYFSTFSLEGPSSNCPYDYIQVRDGSSAFSPLLAKRCGPSVPSAITPTGNTLYVRFKSDSSVTRSGFLAQWSTDGVPTTAAPPTTPSTAAATTTLAPACGGNQAGNSGSFQSPNHPGDYPDRANCSWVITSSPGTRVTLSFSTFFLEGPSSCPYDYVLVRDGYNRQAPLLSSRLCSTSRPAPVTATGNRMFVEFISDSSVNYSGFLAYWSTNAPSSTSTPSTPASSQWSTTQYPFTTPNSQGSTTQYPFTTPNSQGCGGNFTEEGGYIQSINYPSNYPNNAWCAWTFTSEPGTLVRLNFISFNLESHSSCSYDYVAIHDGNSSSSPRIRKLCRSNLPYPVTASGNEMYVIFRSDSVVTRPGFRAYFTSVNATGYTEPYPAWTSSTTNFTPTPTGPSGHITPNCGLNITGSEEGTIQSPNHPYPHHHNAYCVWNITTAPGTEILLVFSSFILEFCYSCNCDSVTVRDGTTANSTILARECGANVLSPIVSTGNSLTIEFTSDSSVSYSGFQAHWFEINSTAGWNLTDYTANFTTPIYNQSTTPTPQLTILPPACQQAIISCASQFWTSSFTSSNFCGIMRQYMQCVRLSCPFVPPIPPQPTDPPTPEPSG